MNENELNVWLVWLRLIATIILFASADISDEVTQDAPSEYAAFHASEVTLVPALSAVCVPMGCASSNHQAFDATVEPAHSLCIKEDIFLPHCVVPEAQRRSSLWVVNRSGENKVIPAGTKTAFFKEHKSTPLAVLADVPHKRVGVCSDNSKILPMISKSISTDERRTIVNVLNKDLSIFGFASSRTNSCVSNQPRN